jgi:hypothetical protein
MKKVLIKNAVLDNKNTDLLIVNGVISKRSSAQTVVLSNPMFALSVSMASPHLSFAVSIRLAPAALEVWL